MGKTEVIACHGWGFDAQCWKNWEEIVPDAVDWKSFDRGYFGDEKSPTFSDENSKKILLTHSFGLHLCDKKNFKQADLIGIFAGFLRFHPQAAQFQRRSKQVVEEMIRQFDEQPQKVLKAFYRNVFHPGRSFELPPDEMNMPLLLGDLKWLNRSDRKLPGLKKSAKVCIFHGSEDAIIPKQKGRALYEQLNEKNETQYFEMKAAGHALLITHAEKCWQIIKDEININL